MIRVETIIPPVPDQAPPPCRADLGTLTVGALAGEEVQKRNVGVRLRVHRPKREVRALLHIHAKRAGGRGDRPRYPGRTDEGRPVSVSALRPKRVGNAHRGQRRLKSGGGARLAHRGDARRGVYTVEATTFHASRTGSFTLTVSYAAPRANCDPGSLGNMSYTRVPMTASVSENWPSNCVSAAAAGGQAAYYTFDLLVSETVEISLTSAAAGANPLLYLRSGTRTFGAHIASDDDGGTGNAALMSRALPKGTYTIEAASQTAAATGTFSLSVAFSCSADMGALAATGVVSGSWVSGCASTDQTGHYARFYTFSLSAAAFVEINLESDNADPYLYLRAGDGTRSGAAIERDDDGGGGSDSRIIRRLTAGATYTIEATTADAADAGSFTLTLAPSFITVCAAAPLTLTDGSTNSPANQSWTSSCGSAQIPRGYAKHYTFTLAAPKLMTIELASTVADTRLYLIQGGSALGAAFIGQDPPAHGGTPTRASRIERILARGFTPSRRPPPSPSSKARSRLESRPPP